MDMKSALRHRESALRRDNVFRFRSQISVRVVESGIIVSDHVDMTRFQPCFTFIGI